LKAIIKMYFNETDYWNAGSGEDWEIISLAE
jgi:hypothetical protein